MDSMGRVIVGVDGSEVAIEALRFAAREAQVRERALLIVHADEVATAGRRSAADRAVDRSAAEVVAAVAPEVSVDFLHTAGNPAAVLTDLSGGAELIVVGTHRTGRLRGFVLGSTSQHVAAHARCPVITVGDAPPAPHGPIMVGAARSEGGLAALRFACREAQYRHAAVCIVRAVTAENWTALGYGYGLASGIDILESAARVELDHVLKVARREFPDVPVSASLSNAYPFSALETASRDASLMVVGSHRGEDALLPHLGPVAAWLLHQSQCPLAVVPFLSTASAASPALTA